MGDLLKICPWVASRVGLGFLKSQSNEVWMYVYVVPWSEFPIVPSYPHYPHTEWGLFCRNMASSSPQS